MIETVVFSWYLLTASGLTGGSVQAEDPQECQAARQDKELELSAKVVDQAGNRIPGTGWFVGACRSNTP